MTHSRGLHRHVRARAGCVAPPAWFARERQPSVSLPLATAAGSCSTLTARFHATAASSCLFSRSPLLVTYPQVRGLGTSVPYHSDPYFSMWRLAWVAHAIHTDPRALFEANIFYPAHDTLGYSDAMLLPGTALAPLFWAGINPVLIYNLALFAAFALSGYAAFLLARALTGSVTGSIVAGVIYAFAPYRFCHYMHLELQIVFWIPFALLLIHRIVANGRVRDGVMLGLTVAAQLLSSVYLGIFSLTYFAVLMPALLVLTGVRHARRLLVPTAVGATLTIAIVAPYGARIQERRARRGDAQSRRGQGLQCVDDELPVGAGDEPSVRMDGEHRSHLGRRDEPVPGGPGVRARAAGHRERAGARQIRLPRRPGGVGRNDQRLVQRGLPVAVRTRRGVSGAPLAGAL